MFRATVLKTLGRVGSVVFLRIETSIIRPQRKKTRYFRKKRVYGRPVPIGRDGLPET